MRTLRGATDRDEVARRGAGEVAPGGPQEESR